MLPTSVSLQVSQAIQFLHELGSLQHFTNEFLKSYVVINPQWIVDVMACVVSVKDSAIKVMMAVNARMLSVKDSVIQVMMAVIACMVSIKDSAIQVMMAVYVLSQHSIQTLFLIMNEIQKINIVAEGVGGLQSMTH